MSDERVNEIYRVFGHAAFYAYLYEAELAALAGTLRAITFPYQSKAEAEQFDAFLRSKRTAGQFASNELKPLTDGSADWKKFLETTSDARNRLIHRFYEEQLPNLFSDSGQDFVIKELKIIAVQLMNGCEAVKSLYHALAQEHLSIDDNSLQEVARQTLKRWQSD